MSGNGNILITGATGAIGIEVLRRFKAGNQLQQVSVLIRDSRKNHKKMREFEGITVHYGDVTQPETLKKACKNKDVIIHMAAVIPPAIEDDPGYGWKVNVEGTRNMVNAVQQESPDALFIYTSSVAIYGDRLQNPCICCSDTIEPHEDHYSNSKIEAEKIVTGSDLNWAVLRLTAIMGVGNHKVSGLMFKMPLDTIMEFATVRDTATAIAKAVHHKEALKHRIFNLAGGEACTITYREFLGRAFDAFGLGKVNFPEYTFAHKNFHCGYFKDSEILEEILHFRSDTTDSYFERFRASVPPIQRFFTRPFAGIVKFFLTRASEPYRAYKNNDKEKIEFFFGNIEE